MRKLALACLGYSAAVLLCTYLYHYGLAYCLFAGAVLAAAAVLLLVLRQRGKALRLVLFGLAAGFLYFALYAPNTVLKAEALSGEERELVVVAKDYPRSYSGGCSLEAELATKPLPSLGITLYDSSFSLQDAEPGQYWLVTAKLKSTDTHYGESYEDDHARGVFLKGTITEPARTLDRNAPFRFLPAKLRHTVSQRAEQLFSPAVRAFMQSLMLGDKTEFYKEESLAASLSRAGVMHIVAVSGMHISFVLGAVQLMFGASRRSSLVCIACIWFFVLLTGASPSAARAGLMQSIALLAPVFRREKDSLTSLAFALAVLLCINPFAVRSVSLQLSFAAVAGILFFSEKFSRALLSLFKKRKKAKLPRYFCSIAASSFAAMVLTVPLTALHFGSVQVLSVITNMPILWAVSLCFGIGYLAVLVSFFLPGFGKVLALVPEVLAKYIIACSKGISALPFSSLYTCGDYTLSWVAGVYAVFLLFAFLPVRQKVRIFMPGALSVLSLIALIVFTGLKYSSYDAVFSVLDVGQGQCAVVFSGEDTVLVDCGNIMSGIDPGETAGQYLLSCGRKQVDLLLLTHLHEDHACGVPMLMEYIPVQEIVLYQNFPDEDGMLAPILAAAEKHGTKVTYISEIATAQCGSITLDLYVPQTAGDENEMCVTALISAGGREMLLTGDAPASAEEKLLAHTDLFSVDFLVAGHHGSKYSSCAELISACPHAIGIISTGYNTYGHPSPEALERLSALRAVYRTDECGTLQFTIG